MPPWGADETTPMPLGQRTEAACFSPPFPFLQAALTHAEPLSLSFPFMTAVSQTFFSKKSIFFEKKLPTVVCDEAQEDTKLWAREPCFPACPFLMISGRCKNHRLLPAWPNKEDWGKDAYTH